jgi:hypothetical protein
MIGDRAHDIVKVGPWFLLLEIEGRIVEVGLVTCHPP